MILLYSVTASRSRCSMLRRNRFRTHRMMKVPEQVASWCPTLMVNFIEPVSSERSEGSCPSPTVLLQEGPPTREEMLAHYPAKFTWEQIKTFINSGDLGLLKRDKKLQQRYDAWTVSIRAQYGSLSKYLLEYRLQWGKPDRLSFLPSILDKETNTETCVLPPNTTNSTTDSASHLPVCFSANTPPEYLSIIQNDWPYSVPPNIEHTLIWTRLPIFHPSIIPQQIAARVEQDGLWGFTGSTSPPPSPSSLPSCLPALADWDITIDKLIWSQRGTDEEEAMLKRTGDEIHQFVRNRWREREWETAWFVNPPRLQSVLDLAHIHVFARHKTTEEMETYDRMIY